MACEFRALELSPCVSTASDGKMTSSPELRIWMIAVSLLTVMLYPGVLQVPFEVMTRSVYIDKIGFSTPN